jgi:hypothetical protein
MRKDKYIQDIAFILIIRLVINLDRLDKHRYEQPLPTNRFIINAMN